MNFQERVLELCKKIPCGRVTTYKEIGKALGGKGQVYRAVGRALHDNKLLVVVPCHRVVASDGGLGGYSKGVDKKIKLLKKEGVIIKNNKINLKKYLFRFKK
ncbi:cysteine methyltransferase [Candidatus Woesearchaeota archaeon]|nr:MAG: cysteine methyltransferase [Candidatus Woesearchaeota archaeon]